MLLRPSILLGMVISIVTGIAVGLAGFSNWRASHASDALQLETLTQVMQHVRASYVDEVSTDQLLQDAMRGMLKGLDPHSTYLNSGDYEDLQSQTTGSFNGVGIELGLVENFFTVISPIDNTPAARAGLQSGDRILEVDHESLKGKLLTDVIHSLRGEVGTSLHLRLERQADEQTRRFDVELERAYIAITSVRSEWLDDVYAYVRISQFQTETGRDFHKTIKKLKRQAKKRGDKLQGLVLDLRNNPGGLLHASVAVADALLKDGLIVYTEGRLASSQLKYRAAGKDYLNGIPIVVLINGGSASAAEIVAGALQDQHRAVLMGERSYGKGSVQSVVPLTDTQAIKLTTAYYYTPNGRSIHHNGIEPDFPFSTLSNLADTEPHAQDPLSSYEAQLRNKALTLLQSGQLQARLSETLDSDTQ